MRTLLAFLALCMSAAAAAPKVVDHAHNLTYVGTTSTGVEHFLNIRYGQDTGGVNRFRHPVAYTYKSNTVVQATKLGPACPQKTDESLFGFSSDGGITQLSEDCLSLRVDRPFGTTQDAKLPVMVWIYGGGDEMGSINEPLYDPTALLLGAALKGFPVIFVAMNYRVNGESLKLCYGSRSLSDSVFGFANSEALRQEGSLNSGLLDQRLALKWVQKNIAVFGGDPSSITLFGQSDGAVGAGLHMTAYGGKGPALFQRAIMESGSPVGDNGVSGNFTVGSTATVASIAGCSAISANATLNCLRGLSTTDLLTAVMTYENQTSTQTAQDIFFPVIDGSLIPAAPSELLRTGRFHKVSLVAGWNYNDGSIFSSTSLSTDTEVQGYVLANYPHLTSSTVTKLLSLYPTSSFEYLAQRYSNANLTLSPQFFRAAQIYRDLNFACPALYTAYQVAVHGAKTYLYEVNQTAFASLELLGAASYEGVFHVGEIPYVFNDPGEYLGTPGDTLLASQVSGSWAHFAATGDPVGNATLSHWTVGFTGADLGAAKKNGGVVQSAEVRVIGGQASGMKKYGVGGPEELIKRCQFVNTAGFYAQLET